ncbi:hypothetical protein Bbelb_222200 [Branchiostoma belcheri]|nr:hypothetical protein Bbelb_222200 [Branchiostoma belcheri]
MGLDLLSEWLERLPGAREVVGSNPGPGPVGLYLFLLAPAVSYTCLTILASPDDRDMRQCLFSFRVFNSRPSYNQPPGEGSIPPTEAGSRPNISSKNRWRWAIPNIPPGGFLHDIKGVGGRPSDVRPHVLPARDLPGYLPATPEQSLSIVLDKARPAVRAWLRLITVTSARSDVTVTSAGSSAHPKDESWIAASLEDPKCRAPGKGTLHLFPHLTQTRGVRGFSGISPYLRHGVPLTWVRLYQGPRRVGWGGRTYKDCGFGQPRWERWPAISQSNTPSPAVGGRPTSQSRRSLWSRGNATDIRALQPSLNSDGGRHRLSATYDPLLTETRVSSA